MPVKKMTPDVCQHTDAGAKSNRILSRKKRLINAFRNAAIKGSFIASAVGMLVSVFCVEIWLGKSLLLFVPCAAWSLAVGYANQDRWIFDMKEGER